MILILFLSAVEVLAAVNKYPRHRRLDSYGSYEWKQTAGPASLPAGDAASASTPPSWWLSIKTRGTSETATAPSRADRGSSVFSPVGNVTLTPHQVRDLAKDLDGLDYIIEEQSVNAFNDSIPALHKLVRQWLMELLNKTKMDTNFTMPEIARWVDSKRPASLDFKPGNENEPHPQIQRQNQYRTPPSLHTPHGPQERSPGSKYNPEHRTPSALERPAGDKTGLQKFAGFEERKPANENISGYRERIPLTKSPLGSNARPSEAARPTQYSDERDLPPERPEPNDYQGQYGSQPYPPGPQEVPPNFQENQGSQGFQPGSVGFSPGGYKRYPPGLQEVPPHYQEFAVEFQGMPPGTQIFKPGSRGLPPGGYERYPPILGSQEARFGSQPYPPAPEAGPPDYQEYPPGSQRLPSGSQAFKPGAGGIPPEYEQFPQGPQKPRFGSQPYPPRPQDYQAYPPGSQISGPKEFKPGFRELPPRGYERYPVGPQGAQSGPQPYPAGLQKVPPNYPAGSPRLPPGSQGMPPDYEQLARGPQEALSGSHSYQQLPMSQRFRPSSQGYPPGSQGFLQGQQMMLTSPVVPRPTPGEPEVSLVDIPVPAEYRDMVVNRPDYADMMENVDQRPAMVNDLANSMILFGRTTTTTTTMHPLVSALKQDMVSSRRGFFTTFASKLLELLATKDKDAAGRLLIANDMNLNSMETEGLLRFLGMPLQPTLLKASQVLAAMAPDLVQSYATIAHQALKQRQMLPDKVDVVLNTLDSMYLAQEGEALFASLTLFDEYPGNNLTSRPVMRAVFEAVFAPFFRMKGTDRLASVIRQMNDFVTEYYPSRRSYPREYKHPGINKDHQRNSKDINMVLHMIEKDSKAKATSIIHYLPYTKITYFPNKRNNGKETRKIIDGITNEPNKRKKDEKYKSVTDETKNDKLTILNDLSKLSMELHNAMKVNPIAKKIDTSADKKTKSKNAAKKSGYKLKTKGLTIETDREFTIKKHKHKTDDFKKHVKHKIRNHLKNKHRNLFENLRNKHKKAKALAEHQIHDSKRSDHNYETLLKNKYRYEDNPHTNVETIKPTDSSYQKRINVVDITPIDTKFIPNEKTIKPYSNKLKTGKAENMKKSKYLFKYKPKKTAKGFVNLNKLSKIGIEDLSSADEREMKFSLQDTLRHGDRQFIERRNYRNRDRKNLHELSSYSDEEGVLKNNIYKVFGYTQGRIKRNKG